MVNLSVTENLINVKNINKIVADIIKTQPERVHYQPIRNTIILDLKRNRHIKITLKELEQLKEQFKCEDIIISSPIRCKIHIHLQYEKEKHHCCCKCKHCKHRRQH